MAMVYKIDKDYLGYKIKKNYIKYMVKNDRKYIDKILNLVNKSSTNNIYIGGGKSDTNLSLDFILKNIDIIINDIELFNKILSIIEKHDELMIKINPRYNKFVYNQNILDYIDKVYNQEFIFV